MSEPTAPQDKDSEAEKNIFGENPSMHVDYRVFEITVFGGDDDSVDDVNEVMNERLETALNQIEDLKRTDFELDDEFDVDRNGPDGMMTQ